MAESVYDKIRDIVCEALSVSPDQVNPGARFMQDLGADSLAIVEMIMKIEEDLEVEIPDEEAEKMSTVGDAVTYVEAHLA
ncbi:MAG TPA: acyl carrier protein [Armatimonadetes bacterium]|nr:acyl carrier protein [Armatimonadota bacterium]